MLPRKFAAIAAGVAFTGATLLGVAPADAQSAPAEPRAGTCWKATNGQNRYWCHNRVGMPVYKHPSTTQVIGYISSNPSWFYCRYDTGANHGGTHPQRWLNTLADNGKEGYVNDNDIIDETNGVKEACHL